MFHSLGKQTFLAVHTGPLFTKYLCVSWVWLIRRRQRAISVVWGVERKGHDHSSSVEPPSPFLLSGFHNRIKSGHVIRVRQSNSGTYGACPSLRVRQSLARHPSLTGHPKKGDLHNIATCASPSWIARKSEWGEINVQTASTANKIAVNSAVKNEDYFGKALQASDVRVSTTVQPIPSVYIGKAPTWHKTWSNKFERNSTTNAEERGAEPQQQIFRKRIL